MRLAFIDCDISGVSGDMLIGGLIDAGAPAGKVRKAMLAVGELFGEIEVDIKRVRVNEIRAVRVRVKTSNEGLRVYGEVMKKLGQLSMSQKVKEAVIETVKVLGEAEARVHGKRLEHLVLREVGAADAIADIIGCCTAADDLGLFGDRVLAGEVAVGRGAVESTHGRLPLPAPAVLEILKGKPIRGVASDVELTTPTGAALLVALADEFVNTFPAMRVKRVGYGTGTRRLPTPNLLRVCVGETSEPRLELGRVALLETNVDDVPGEIIAHTIEKLLAEGALDASATPTLMKKGRPGFSIQVIAEPGDAERLARVLVAQVGTLGVRLLPSVHRYELEREIKRVEFGLAGLRFKARVKVARSGGKLIGLRAEYEDAKAIAEKVGMPIRETMKLIEEIAKRKFVRNHSFLS